MKTAQETIRELLSQEASPQTVEKVLMVLSEPLSKAAQFDEQCRLAEERRRGEVLSQVDRVLFMRGARSNAAARALLPMEELLLPGKAEKDIALAVDKLVASAEGGFLFAPQEGAALVQVGVPVPEGEEAHSVELALWKAAGLGK